MGLGGIHLRANFIANVQVIFMGVGFEKYTFILKFLKLLSQFPGFHRLHLQSVCFHLHHLLFKFILRH